MLRAADLLPALVATRTVAHMAAERRGAWAMNTGRAAGFGLVALLGGCAGSNVSLQQLLALPAPAETSVTGGPAAQPAPLETTVLVAGTPTSTFAQVARGAIGCWFSADGPLKASHVYRAEAEPPAKGGHAEIVIHERDASQRDPRGPRAYRITFAAEASGVRVVATALRFEPKLAQAMANDVERWAKGGEGCDLRALFPSAPQAAAKPGKTVKGQPLASSRKR